MKGRRQVIVELQRAVQDKPTASRRRRPGGTKCHNEEAAIEYTSCLDIGPSVWSEGSNDQFKTFARGIWPAAEQALANVDLTPSQSYISTGIMCLVRLRRHGEIELRDWHQGNTY